MVNNAYLKELLKSLIIALNEEYEHNAQILPFFHYMKPWCDRILEMDIIPSVQNEKIFLGGAHRFADEFEFTNGNNSEIKVIMSKIFNLLNSAETP